MENSLPLEIFYSVKLQMSFLLKQQFQMVTFEDPDEFQVQDIKLEIKHVLGYFDTDESFRAASQIGAFLLPFVVDNTRLISVLCLVDGTGNSCSAGEKGQVFPNEN